MRHCECCKRELQVDEQKYCPACSSNRSHKTRRRVEIITGLTIALILAGKALAKKAEK